MTVSWSLTIKVKIKENKIPLDHPDNLFQIEVTHVRKLFLDYIVKNINCLNDDEVILSVEIDESNILRTMLNFRVINKEILHKKTNSVIFDKNIKKIKSWLYYQNMCLGESNQREEWRKIILNIISNHYGETLPKDNFQKFKNYKQVFSYL